MGLSAVLCELAALEDLDGEVAEYLVSSLSDAAEESGEPLDQHSVLEVIGPFVEGVGLEEEQVAALASRVAQLLSTPDELDEALNPTPDEAEQPPQEGARSAREARRAKLSAPEPELAPEPEQEPAEPESEAEGADQQLAFLRESFPSLSTQEIRQILRQTRGQVDDRAFELLFERQAARAEAAETAPGAPAGAIGTGVKSRQLSEAAKREETKRRRALLERYENSASAVAGHRKNATGGLKTVHGRLPTKAEAARQKAAEQRSKVRYFEGAIVTRSGEKYTPVPLSKEEEEREKALVAATSVNLAYKTSKGRRHRGR